MNKIETLWSYYDEDESSFQRNLQSTESDDFNQNVVHDIYVLALILATIGLIVSLFSALFIFVFRSHRILSMAQPPFMCLICLGCLLMAVSLYFTAITIDGSINDYNNSNEDSHSDRLLDVSCVFQTWFQYMGDLILYTALFSKLWRVHKVCSSHFRRTEVKVQNVIIPLLMILIAAVGVLIAWTVDDPPSFENLVFESSSSESSTRRTIRIGFCTRHPIYNTVMLSLIELSGIVALWMSCKTQNVRSDISDSTSVQKTLFAHVIINLLALILLNLGYFIQNFSLMMITMVLSEFLTAIIPLCFLIFPKIYCIVYEWKTGELPDGIIKKVQIHVTGIETTTTDTTTIMTKTNMGNRPSSAEEPLVLGEEKFTNNIII